MRFGIEANKTYTQKKGKGQFVRRVGKSQRPGTKSGRKQRGAPGEKVFYMQ